LELRGAIIIERTGEGNRTDRVICMIKKKEEDGEGGKNKRT
jgi:hypothetical protein